MMKVTLITPESYPKEKPVDGFWEENNDRDNMESMMKKDGDGVEVFNGQDDSDDSEYDDVEDRNCMMDMYNGNSDSGDEISTNSMNSHILKENNNNVAWEKCKDKMMPKQQLPEQQTPDDFNDSRMKAPFHSYTSDGEVSKSSTPASSSKDIPAQQVSHIPANLLFSEEAINLSVHKDNDSDDDDQSESVVENDSEEREEVPVQITNDQTHHSKPENGSNVVVIMPEDPSAATSRAFESSTNPRSSMKIFNKKDKSKRSFEKRPQGEESGHVVRAPMVPIPVMPEGFFSHHSFLAAQSSNAHQQKRKRKGIPEYVPDLTKKKPREYEDSEIEQSNGMSPRDVKLNIKEENDAASKKPLPVDPHLAMWSQLWNPYYFMNMAALHNLQQQQGALNGLMPIAPAPKSPLEPPQKHSPAGKAPPIVCHPPGTPVNLSTRAEPLRSTTDSEAENQPQEEAINLSVKQKPVTSTPSSSTSSSHLAPLDLRPGITDSPIGRGGGGGLHPAFEQVKNWARGYQSGSPSPSTHPGYAPGSEPIRKGCTRTRERWRVTYNEVQTNALEMEFQFNRFVHRQRRYDLSREIGLTERQIKIWFQNRRMKQKKEDKKRLIDKEFNEHTKTTLLEDIKFIMSPGAVASKGEGSSSALGSPGDSSFQKALSEEAESPIARESPSRSLEAGEEEEEGALSS